MSENLDGDDFALLGLVALRGEATAYDLKRGFSHLTAEFWSVPHTNVYERTRRMLQTGMLSAREEQHGRRKRILSVTEQGRAALRAWLANADTPSIEIRDEAQLKLFLSELSSPEDVAALAKRQVEAYERRLQRIAEIEERFGDDPVRSRRMEPLPFGRAVYEAAMDFWLAVSERAEAQDDGQIAASSSTNPGFAGAIIEGLPGRAKRRCL